MSANKKLSPFRSYCFLLYLSLGIALLFVPVSSRADALEDAVRTLARRIASDRALDRFSGYVWQNHSAVPAAFSDGLRKVFEDELNRQHRHHEYDSTSNLEVQLRDGPSVIYVMVTTAEDDSRLVASVAVPKSQLMMAEPPGNAVKLSRQLLWSQPEPLLDVAEFDDTEGKPETLLVLGRAVLSLYVQSEKGWLLKDSAPLPRTQPVTRDLRGEIHLTDHFFQFHLPGIECDGDAFQKLAFECEENKGIWRAGFDPFLPFSLDPGNNFFAVDSHYIGPKKFPLKGFYSAALSGEFQKERQSQAAVAGDDGRTYIYTFTGREDGPPDFLERLPVEWGSNLVSVRRDCRDDTDVLVLAPGAHDHTSPDLLQAFAVNNHSATAVTPILDLPGPILSLHGAEDSDPVAVIFNLATGNYEAYRVKVACAN